MTGESLSFPRDFTLGAAAAAYQIEGSPAAEGKGPSIWDAFSHRRGKVRTGENGDLACDHWRRMEGDVALMRELGIRAYRGSVSWPRVQPAGRGGVNAKGLDFYSRLVDRLLGTGIEPWLTLFHWDLPLALQEGQGGFLARDTAFRLADYAELALRALGDRVKRWITVNEPFEYACFGHFLGVHAPGLRRPWAYFRVMHNLLLGHGLVLERIRALCPGALAGPSLSVTPLFPLRETEGDRRAADLADQFMNRITLDPILKGSYPAELLRRVGPLAPRVEPGDMAAISAPVDFTGINFYSRERAARSRLVPLLGFRVTGKDSGRGETGEAEEARGEPRRTAMGWEVWPAGLGAVARRLRDEYGNPPVVITENGAAFHDEPVTEAAADALGPAGRRVHDLRRLEFLRDYLGSLRGAMAEGCDLRGYFAWSLMDNFEWAEGTRPRFGLIHVDYATQERTIKDSGLWYRELIRRSAGAPRPA